MLGVRWLVLGSISLVAPLGACSGDDFAPTPAGAAGNVGTGGLGGAAGSGATAAGAGTTGLGGGAGEGGTAGSAGSSGAGTGGNAGAGEAGASVGGAGGGPLPGGSAGASAAGASGTTSAGGGGSAGASTGGAAGASGGAGAGGGGTTCGSQLLGLALKDKWGYQWDGNERTAAPLAAAEAVCAGIGGRLPTATEVHRVSAGRTSQIGQVAFTQELWTNVPASASAQITAKLSDGTTLATTLVSTPKVYRCVCAPPPSPGYGNDDCVGDDGPACATFQREGKTYAIDKVDRALLPFGAAEWECRFAGGSLPTPELYVELTTRSTPSGIGSGKLLWHHTSDQSRGDQHMIFRWDADGTWKAAADTISTTSYAAALTGRCFGPQTLPTRSTAAPANAHVVPETQQAFDAADKAAVGINPALEACFQAGGHLPSSLGLFDAITTGAPNGGSAPLWTSDFTEIVPGAITTSSTGLVGWTTIAPRFALINANIGFIRGVKEGAAVHPYRCGYSPVDPSYAGPPSSSCSGNCAKITAKIGAGAFWIDQLDREAAPWPGAIRGCAEAGGRLASERDYFEAIRSGLVGGSNAPVWTSDISAHTVTPFAYAHVVKWKDVDPTYTDAFPTGMTWSLLATPRPYRCAFTNEYR